MSSGQRKRKLKIPSFAKWGFGAGYVVYLIAPWILAATKKPTVDATAVASISRAFQPSVPAASLAPAPSDSVNLQKTHSGLLSTQTENNNPVRPPDPADLNSTVLPSSALNAAPPAPEPILQGHLLDHFQEFPTYRDKDAALSTVEESCQEGCSEETRFALFSVITQMRMIGGSEERALAKRAVGILRTHSPRSETIDDLARSL